MRNVVEIMHEWRCHFLNPGDLIKIAGWSGRRLQSVGNW
jgi:hypothetical protein